MESISPIPIVKFFSDLIDGSLLEELREDYLFDEDGNQKTPLYGEEEGEEVIELQVEPGKYERIIDKWSFREEVLKAKLKEQGRNFMLYYRSIPHLAENNQKKINGRKAALLNDLEPLLKMSRTGTRAQYPEIESYLQKMIDKLRIPSFLDYESPELKKLFPSSKLERLKTIEGQLEENGFFEDGKWHKDKDIKNYFAPLIFISIHIGLIPAKQKTKYAAFLAERYQVTDDYKQAIEPQRFRKNKRTEQRIADFKHSFPFIPEIQNLRP